MVINYSSWQFPLDWIIVICEGIDPCIQNCWIYKHRVVCIVLPSFEWLQDHSHPSFYIFHFMCVLETCAISILFLLVSEVLYLNFESKWQSCLVEKFTLQIFPIQHFVYIMPLPSGLKSFFRKISQYPMGVPLSITIFFILLPLEFSKFDYIKYDMSWCGSICDPLQFLYCISVSFFNFGSFQP